MEVETASSLADAGGDFAIPSAASAIPEVPAAPAASRPPQPSPSAQSNPPSSVPSTPLLSLPGKLNRTVMGSYHGLLAKDPSADLTQLFQRSAASYPVRRKRCLEKLGPKYAPVPAPTQQELDERCPKKRRFAHEDPRQPIRPVNVPTGQLCILRPLRAEVLDLFRTEELKTLLSPSTAPSDARAVQVTGERSTEFHEVLEKGEVLWRCFARWVIKLSDEIVVKIGPDMDVGETMTMEHVHAHDAEIPMPRLLGMIAVGSIKYLFMSFIRGETLKERWADLTTPMKMSVQAELDSILARFRAIPLPEALAGLGSGDPPRCRDGRMHRRISEQAIATEADFNDFLLSSPISNTGDIYLKFLRRMLRNDHRLVMTHGDLQPCNIIVSGDGDAIKVVGLIDWEMGGVYPEYWEYVKALNNFSPLVGNDWCLYLPERGMGRYQAEYNVDIMIDRIIG